MGIFLFHLRSAIKANSASGCSISFWECFLCLYVLHKVLLTAINPIYKQFFHSSPSAYRLVHFIIQDFIYKHSIMTLSLCMASSHASLHEADSHDAWMHAQLSFIFQIPQSPYYTVTCLFAILCFFRHIHQTIDSTSIPNAQLQHLNDFLLILLQLHQTILIL